MYSFHLDYASPSAFESQREKAVLGLATDLKGAAKFRARIRSKSTFLVRTALRATFEVLWQLEYWDPAGTFTPPDPLVTVHPDKLFFETFSHDRSAHVLLSLDRSLFEDIEQDCCGTSHFEMSAWLWAALGEMRSHRTTRLHLDGDGLELKTVGGGGRFEKRCEVTDDWLRAYLELQAAASLKGVRFQVKPVDLLALLRFLRYTRPNTSPKAIRYEFEPGQPVRVVAEPWERTFVFRDCEHSYTLFKSTRLWGRKRLRLLEPLLPYATTVDIFVKGRALPSFYTVRLPGIEFHLSLTGWADQRFDGNSGLHLLASPTVPEASRLDEALEKLRSGFFLTRASLAESLNLEPSAAGSLLSELCRRGYAFYRQTDSEYRYRPMFTEEPDISALFPVNTRLQSAQEMVRRGCVNLSSLQPRETRKLRKLKSPEGPKLVEAILRDWCAEGKVDGLDGVEVVLDEMDRIIFGRCSCRFFSENLLNLGPCEHLLALRLAACSEREELPSSRAVDSDQEETDEH